MEESKLMTQDDWRLQLQLNKALKDGRNKDAQLKYFDTRQNHIGHRMALSALEKAGIKFPAGFEFDNVSEYKTSHETGDTQRAEEIYENSNYETRQIIDRLFE
ncbi:hypothetical protein HY450_00230 [Candidatus Pacearchaeota archaeon]|nr:hypothetical protein [Candidatus Pacearchaeota archaeon]